MEGKAVAEKKEKTPTRLVEDVDFYFENGLMVLTAHFLLNRGYCCSNGCRHCPYDDEGRPIQSK
ncbi:MAG: hypothetical protein HKN33_16480 [Pyrinomonadaceae bacterium]|nr:hypothetical protein [Pyrinomonadaceae bacterium]